MEKAMTLDGGIEYVLSAEERAGVRAKYPDTYFADPVLEPLWFGRREKLRVLDKVAIVDQTAEKGPATLGICSEKYKIIHFEDIIHMIENSAGKLEGYGAVEVKPHTYLDGGRLKCTINFPDMKTAIKQVDSVIPKIEVFSSYDLSTKLTGRFGAFQLKCTNGMGIWKSFKQFAKRHLQNLFLNDLGEVTSQGLAIFGEQVHQWKLWGEMKVPEFLYEEMWASLPFSEKERERIEALPEIGTGMLLSEAKKGIDS